MASRFFSKLLGAKDELQSHVLEVAETYMKREDAGEAVGGAGQTARRGLDEGPQV